MYFHHSHQPYIYYYIIHESHTVSLGAAHQQMNWERKYAMYAHMLY